MSSAQTMARERNLAKGRAVLAERRQSETRLRSEILGLRGAVGAELNRMYGASGLNVNLSGIDEEYVPELKSLHSRISVYDQMANDPNVRGQIRAIFSTLISGVRWKVVGGSQENQDLLAANLLRQGPRKFWCSTSWLDRLYETLGCLIYGFALFAKTRSLVEGKIIFGHLKWLHPRSVDEDGWVADEEDSLIQVRRTYREFTGGMKPRVPISASELFIVPWDRRGPNWEGNAYIRPMYRPWKLGVHAEKIDIIDLQNRGVGIPIAHLSGAGGPKEKDTLIEILKSLRGGSKERAFIVLEKDEKVGYLLSEGQSKDAQPTIAHHRNAMATSAGREYAEQGNTSTGSRAVGSVLATGFYINVNAIQMQILDMINDGAGPMLGLSEELGILNFGEQDEYSRIVGSTISPTEQLDNIPIVGDLVQKGVVPRNRKLANETLRRLDYPELTEEEWKEAIAESPAPNSGGAGRPNEAGQDGQGRDDTESRRFGLRAEKKTLGGESRLTKSGKCWPWIGSSPA